jgi:Tfp pilus assembly protein PilX
MRHLNLRPRGSTEAGFIIPTAVIILFVITVLTGSAIAVAVQSSTSTTRDSTVKAALEASEGGLQVAEYRINQLKPSTTQCISATEQKTSEGECTSGSESIGNGGSFQYWTTLPLAAGAKCAGESVVVKSGTVQRCVTSVGKVNGVEPGTRLQTRVESAVGEALFSIHGILGLEEVKVSGSVKATAVVASNGLIKGEGSAAFEKGFEICPPTGSFKPAAGTERNKSGVTIGGIGGMQSNPPLEITRTSGCPIEAKIPSVHATALQNEDSRIGTSDTFFTEGKAVNKFTGSPTYELNLSSNSKLTLAGSKYYFCKFNAEKNGEAKIALEAKVEMVIDSHEDNSNCPTGTGTFTIEGSSHLENPNGAGNLLIMMIGKGPFTIANSGTLKANIYAPEAEVILSGSGTLTGAIVGKKVKLEAGSFNFSAESETIEVAGSSGGAYTRKGWQQCTPSSSEPSKASC